jgi:preprotein translocase subunit SecE
VSDERDSAGSAGADTDTDSTDAQSSGQTVVVTRPARPTGKRARRAVEVVEDDVESGAESHSEDDAEADSAEADSGKKKSAGKKKAKSKKDGPSRNPILFVWNYLKQVVAELRKVIWPNRKEMITYTSVVLTFLVFMVALIFGVDFGLAKLVMLVFG